MIDSEQLCEEFVKENQDLKEKHDNYNNQIMHNNIYAAIGFVFVAIDLILVFTKNFNLYFAIVVAVLGLFLILKSINENVNSLKKQKEYEELYTSRISSFIINKYFDDSTCYEGIAFDSLSKFDKANYDKDADKVLDKRHLSIKYKDYKIAVMEIIAAQQDIVNVQEDGDVKTDVSYVFEGLFNEFKLKHSVGTRISITDPYGKNRMNCKELLEMDYSKFEKEFDVYTNDKVKAMEFLTVDVLVKLEEIHRNSKLGFDILIDNDTVYIRIPVHKKMFEMSYELVNKEAVERDNENIYLLKEIIDALIVSDN